MTELRVDRVRLTVHGAEGQEHRLAPLGERTAAALQELLAERPLGSAQVAYLAPEPVELDLALVGDAEAARRLAEAVYSSLSIRLGP
jgi:hypothetical protein